MIEIEEIKGNKSVFDVLNAINVNDHKEEKNGLSYVSWAWAIAELFKNYPEAEYTIWKDEKGLPYVYDEKTGYMVYTSVTIHGQTKEMWLPVMDGANQSMKAEPYSYTVKNKNHKFSKLDKDTGKYFDRYGNEQPEYITKTVEAATMFDINKTIMRCLVKNLAMFGLGLYIYAGEDLPEGSEETYLDGYISERDLQILNNMLNDKQAEYVLNELGISDLSQMTNEQYGLVMRSLQKKEQEKDGNKRTA